MTTTDDIIYATIVRKSGKITLKELFTLVRPHDGSGVGDGSICGDAGGFYYWWNGKGGSLHANSGEYWVNGNQITGSFEETYRLFSNPVWRQDHEMERTH